VKSVSVSDYVVCFRVR